MLCWGEICRLEDHNITVHSNQLNVLQDCVSRLSYRESLVDLDILRSKIAEDDSVELENRIRCELVFLL